MVHRDNIPDIRNACKRQLIQNSVVFAGVFFSHQLMNPWALLLSFMAYVILCIYSYVIMFTANLVQREKGEWQFIFLTLHGKFPKWIIWLFWSTVLISFTRPSFGVIAAVCFLIACAHELSFSRQIILDVVSLATEFSLKAIAGVEVLYPPVELSPWLVGCAFLLSLVVALGKRRNEMIVSRDDPETNRALTTGYSINLLDQMMAVVTSSAFIAYVLYTISERTIHMIESTDLVYSAPFVLFGILRYIYMVYKKDLSLGAEIAVLVDIPMIINLFLWSISIMVIAGQI